MKTLLTTGRCLVVLLAVCAIFLPVATNAQCEGLRANVTNGPLVNLCSDVPVKLTASPATAGNLFQWQKQLQSDGNFENIAGASAAEFQTGDLGAYRVIVGIGACSDTSSITSIIKLSLNGGAISGGPTSKICTNTYVGSLLGTPVMSDGSGLTRYQWQIKEGNGIFNDIPLAKGVDYNAGYVLVTTTYRRAIIDQCGNAAYSNELVFTVYDAVTSGSLQPAIQTVVIGQIPAPITSATPSVGEGTLSYQWQAAPAPNAGWINIANATGETYQPAPVNVTTYFRRIVQSTICNSTTATTQPVLVQQQNPLVLNAGVLYSDNVCLFTGNTPLPIGTLIKPVGGTAPYTIAWEQKTGTGDWTTIAGEQGDKIFSGPITQTTSYRKKVTDALGITAFTEPVTLSVISTPLDPGQIFTASTVTCLDASPTQLLSGKSAANFGERGTYQWQVKIGNTDWVNLPGATRGYYQPQPLTEQTSFRRAFFDYCGPNGRSAYSNEITIDVKAAVLPGSISPATQLVIPGRTPRKLTSNEAPSGGTNTYTTWWEKATLAVGPFTKIEGATTLEYQPPAATKTTYYRRVVKDMNCLAEKVSYVIEVFVPDYPTLVGGSLSGSGCVFANLQPTKITIGSVSVSGGIGPYTFIWESRIGSTLFSPVSGATAESYQPPVLTQTTQYRRRMTDAYGGSAYSDTFTIQLITTALVPGTIEAENSNICSGVVAPVIKSVLDASGFGTEGKYQWQQRFENTSFTDISGANQKEYGPGVINQTTYFRRLYIDGCGGTTRTGYSNEVMIKATPATQLLGGLVNGPFITCAGTLPGSITNVLSACGSCNLQHQWQYLVGSDWKNIDAATGPSYTPDTLQNTTRYRRMVTDGIGRNSYSNEVEILVYPGISAGVIGADTQVVCKNIVPPAIALLTDCHYTDGAVTYQWQQKTAEGNPWADITGANAPAYQPLAAATTTWYRLKIMSTTCGASAFTNTAIVMVKSECAVTISSTEPNIANCLPIKPVALTFPVQACNSANILEWEYQKDTAASWTATGVYTNNLLINSYYEKTDLLIKWRLKITNSDCNTILYSNVLVMNQFSCRSNQPVVYPNPATPGGTVFVRSTDKPHRFSLKTIDGKELGVRIVAASQGLMRLQLPTTLPTGTYVLIITNADGRWAEKILIGRK